MDPGHEVFEKHAQYHLLSAIKYFALPKSNRGFKPSVFIETLILMQHEGSFHLDDDVRHINI